MLLAYRWMRQLDDQLNAVEHHLPLVVPFTQADSRQHDEADLLKDNMFFSGTLAHLPSSAEVAEAAENGGRRKPVKGRLREKACFYSYRVSVCIFCLLHYKMHNNVFMVVVRKAT